MSIKRNISGVIYDVISPSYYMRHDAGMRILLGYTGGDFNVLGQRIRGDWVTWINDEAVGRDPTLQEAGDAIAAGLHCAVPSKGTS